MITKRMKIQAIADRLAGLSTNLTLKDFGDPDLNTSSADRPAAVLRIAWEALDNCPPGEEVDALMGLPISLEERQALVSDLEKTIPGTRLGVLKSVAEIEPLVQPIEWLWGGWIPRGMITLLAASPGSGKSLLALDLCRRLIHGEPYPDNKGAFKPGSSVIYLDAENAPSIFVERLRAWDIDRSRIFLKLPGLKGFVDLEDPDQRDAFIEEINNHRPALIVIDSLATITSRGENYVEEIRELLSFLNQLAMDFNCALLLIHHLRKSGFQGKNWYMGIDDIRGSGHIIAVARSVLGLSLVQVGETIDRNAPRRLETIKTNLGPLMEPLSFDLQPLEPRGVRLNWGEAPDMKIDLSLVEQCMRWLVELLQNNPEPLKPRYILALGRNEGYNERAIFRARARLHQGNTEFDGYIRSTDGRQNSRSLWQWIADSGTSS
jgi:putative DNA primase/helicase